MPSGDVITLVPAVPLSDVATNNPSDLAQQMLYHWFAAAAFLLVQFIPSGDVMTRLVPSKETAANRLSSGDHAIEVQRLFCDAGYPVQFTPLDDVITRLVPLDATATNSLSSEAYVTFIH
jgi:hypothetical protein